MSSSAVPPASAEENVGVASYNVSSMATVPPKTIAADATTKKTKQGVPGEEEEKSSDVAGDGSMTTAALEVQLQSLRDKSNALSQELTQRLASSESGQNLLQIGPSLSTLPPDLSSLLSSASPLLEDMKVYVKQNEVEYDRLLQLQQSIQTSSQKSLYSQHCIDVWQELTHAEEDLLMISNQKLFASANNNNSSAATETMTTTSEKGYEALVQMASLERCAHTCLRLLQQLKSSHEVLNSITKTTSKKTGITSYQTGATSSSPISEKALFIHKLSNRIHSLESSATRCLLTNLDAVLSQIRKQAAAANAARNSSSNDASSSSTSMDVHLMAIGHCLRGLALLSKGKDAESVFARVAIMPLIRSKISIGRMDEGGSRGECAGLFSLLDDICYTITSTYGPVLVLSESIFGQSRSSTISNTSTAKGTIATAMVDIDLVTAGVWIPLATTFMADPTMKMALFSPGIAAILQANFMALNTFLSELAERLLTSSSSTPSLEEESKNDGGYRDDRTGGSLIGQHQQVHTVLSREAIQAAQRRLYRHATTVEFSNKWNLPIYYQLRFGEYCSRLNRAISRVQAEGWTCDVFTGRSEEATKIKEEIGLEVPLFLELYSILAELWSPTVILRPLTHRFLRGAIQLLGRVVSFVRDGLNNQLLFGVEGDDSRGQYAWVDSAEDVATVAWDTTVLESAVAHDYYQLVATAVAPAVEDSQDTNNTMFQNSPDELTELQQLIQEVLLEATEDMGPLIVQSWNDIIASQLTMQCSPPLSAVKGVAATYRMTNRPPPTQASPYVGMILRPLMEFSAKFESRTSPQIGNEWKEIILTTISQKYSVAVEELLETVRRTEEALSSRRGMGGRARAGAAPSSAGGALTDGQKVKLQVYLDFQAFLSDITSLGLSDQGMYMEGVAKLHELTQPAEPLWKQVQQQGTGAR